MRRPFLFTLLLVAPLSAAACGDDDGGTGGGGGGGAGGGGGGPSATLRHDVAVAIAENVIVPTIAAFEASAAALEVAVDAFADAPADTAARDAARAAFRATMALAQRLETMQVGPAGPMSTTLGGQGLRSEIYAWPLTNRCGINQQTATGAYADVDTFAAQPVNVRGLAALEYLLFAPGTDHECTSGAPAVWPPADLAERRADYARTLAVLVRRQGTALRTAWDPAGGDFLGQVRAAGVGASVYPSAQEALNAISDGMFYLDTDTKDMKLAAPANLDMLSCATVFCPEAVESPLTDDSVAHIRENLVAFRALFLGAYETAPAGGGGGGGETADGGVAAGDAGAPPTGDAGVATALGFDDLLAAIGQAALATAMVTEIDQAIAACDAFPKPLEDALNGTDIDTVYALYGEVKDVTDLLKGDFVGLLDLEPPANAAGDND